MPKIAAMFHVMLGVAAVAAMGAPALAASSAPDVPDVCRHTTVSFAVTGALSFSQSRCLQVVNEMRYHSFVDKGGSLAGYTLVVARITGHVVGQRSIVPQRKVIIENLKSQFILQGRSAVKHYFTIKS